MASQERLTKLKSMFNGMDESVINAVMEANPSDDAAIDQLLFMQADPLKSLVLPQQPREVPKNGAAPVVNARSHANPAGDNKDRDLQSLNMMFKNDSLTMSVISTVYQANAGNMQVR
jgi:phage tail protein X